MVFLALWGNVMWRGLPVGAAGSQWSFQLFLLVSAVIFFCSRAACIPHGDAVCEDTLNGRSVECHQQLPIRTVSPEHSEEVESLLCSLDGCCDVRRPREVLRDVDAQEYKCVHPFHTFPIDVERGLVCVAIPSKVQYYFLCFCGVQYQVVH